MANIKKFNPETQSWETWASSSATGVYSVNPALLSEEENVINVEDALIRDREDIDLMKKNISWLALHGGGGSSGGGGGGGSDTSVNNSIEISYEGKVVSTIIWKPSNPTIGFTVKSDKTSNRFKVRVTLDDNTIYNANDVVPNTPNSIRIGNMNKYSTGITHSLKVIAEDKFDNSVMATCQITQITLSVSAITTESIYKLNINEVDKASLVLKYQASIPGDYTLYWSKSPNIYDNPESNSTGYRNVRISTTDFQNLAIRYWTENENDHILTNRNVSNNETLSYYFVLRSNSDLSLKSQLLEIVVTVVSPDHIAIQPITLNTNINNATEISKASVLGANFIVYLESQSKSYTYSVLASRMQWVEDASEENGGRWEVAEQKQEPIASGRGNYGVTQSISYNALPGDDFFEGGNIYKFDIYATDTLNTSITDYASCYITLQPASDKTIPLKLDGSKIFDFRVWAANDIDEQNWTWTSNTNDFVYNGEVSPLRTVANMYYMGGKSRKEAAYCRFTNKAYMVINQTQVLQNGEYNNINWFPSADSSSLNSLISTAPQFTLNIGFYNDFTPDNNRTILNFGNYNPVTQSGDGILINNHDFYIRIGNALVDGKLQDSIYHDLTIVFGKGNANETGKTFVEVYHNGVLLSINKNINVADIRAFNEFNEISIGCYKNSRGELSQFTNLNLQRIALYSTAMNSYQVVCNYINNLVTYKLENNALNTTLLNQKLNANAIIASENGYSCALWDNGNPLDPENHAGFTDSYWIDVDNNNLIPNAKVWETCPIPILILDFKNNPTWDWATFRNSWSETKPDPATGVKIYYYPQKNSENVLRNTTVTVSGQGTTSLGYTIKNLEIDFGNKLFWVKNDWFPERYYTLKADIVDSAHANNASIGKFVNTCAKNTELVNKTPAMEYFDTHKNEFSLPTSTYDSTDGLSVKHTLEGFPVLLIARFADSQNENGFIKSLGIYSFNLGRNAYYNMGFRVLKAFRDENDSVRTDIVAPYVLNAPKEEDVINLNAQCWEGRDSINGNVLSQAQLNNLNAEIESWTDYVGNTTTKNCTTDYQLSGYFWSALPSHINYCWKATYPEGASIEYGFRNLFQKIVQLTYSKGDDFALEDNALIYQYGWDDQNKKMYIPEQSPTHVTRVDGSVGFDIRNARFYYVICMLFGLVDSLGKNLSIRSWKLNYSDDDNNRIWYTCFYDMDTAIGISNLGTQNIAPDVCDEELSNNPNGGGLVKTFARHPDDERIYTVRDNKLWGILDDRTFKMQYGESGDVGGASGADDSYYALAWDRIRSNYLQNVDVFIDNYFGKQTENVGELLYNQDFDVKYVNSQETQFMYGDRKAFVRDWLDKRIKFLDSFFGYSQSRGTASYLVSSDINDCSYKNSITIAHNSGVEYLPVISRCPCIVTCKIGGETTNYYYLRDGVETDIRVANSGTSSSIQTQINNSDLLLEIQDLAYLGVQYVKPNFIRYIDPSIYDSTVELYNSQYGSLSGISKFDISGNLKFTNEAIDFIKLFKTWNNGEDTKPYSLTSLDLSNTKNDRVTNFELNLRDSAIGPNGETFYQNPFENLTDINLYNSCITGVTLPENIALYSLNLAESAVRRINLSGQTRLTTVDFSNCNALEQVILHNCTAFTNLNLNKLPKLNTVEVTECPELTSININMENAESPLTLRVSGCDKLESVIVNYAQEDSVIVLDTTNIKNINFNNSKFTHFILSNSNKNTLESLNFEFASVKGINWGTIELDKTVNIIDVSECPNLTSVYCDNNDTVEYVRFKNIESAPITLKNGMFYNCASLKRIYGNFVIKSYSIFQNSGNFTIHGGKFNGQNVVQNGKQMYIDDTAISGECFEDVFQQGDSVTNLYFDCDSVTACFLGTSCDAFDVYYALWHCNNVTNIKEMFQDCYKIRFISGSKDNSPHWNMFKHCTNVTNAQDLFKHLGNDQGRFRLFSKTNQHDGLLSPLQKCTNFSNIFGNMSFICDPHAFETSSGQPYANGNAINVNSFCPKIIVDSVYKLSGNDVINALTNINQLPSSANNGICTGFFAFISKLSGTLSSFFNGVDYIDYDHFMQIPSGLNTLNGCFNSKAGIGKLDLQQIFADKSQIQNIYYSFRVDSERNNTKVLFEIDNSTLHDFSGLKRIGYVSSAGLNTTESNLPFNGAGLNKVIKGSEFPYDLLHSCRNSIEEFGGFFRDATTEAGYNYIVELPKTQHGNSLFEGCTKLQNINYCFFNFKVPYSLQSNGFTDCISLKKVKYLFGVTCDRQNNQFNVNKLTGSIPNNLFNIGMREEPVTLVGTQTESKSFDVSGKTVSVLSNKIVVQEQDVITGVITSTEYFGVTYEEPNIIYTPLSTYVRIVGNEKQNGTVTDLMGETWTTSSVSFIKKIPNTNIDDMTGCFTGCNTTEYSHDMITEDEIETNADYCPFYYLYSNNRWISCNRNIYPWTYMWIYDGDTTTSIHDGECYLPDDGLDRPCRITQYRNARVSINRFFCAPDLLRWCSENATITNLFAYSGHWRNGNSESLGGREGIQDYGMKGRIVPYLLKPIKRLKSISGLFRCCDMLSSYIDTNDVPHAIPRSFFDYTPELNNLYYAFSGMSFVNGDNLNGVAIALKNQLNLEGVFRNCVWDPTGSSSSKPFTVSGAFSTNKISNTTNAFSIGSTDGAHTTNDGYNHSQYIRFINVFNKNTKDHPQDFDKYVFFGYVGSYVTHEPEQDRTVSTLPERHNYENV